jgi:hypothetical protein
MSFTGEVKRNFKPRVVLCLENDWVGAFVEHHKYIDTEGAEGYFSSSGLVFSLERAGHRQPSLGEIRLISDLLDKLLLYVSFASRQRTTWVALTSIVEGQLVEYYRNIVIPSKISEYDEPLTDRRSIEEFLRHCLAYITNKENFDLYLPLVYLVSADKPGKTAESQFLSLFMSLEALLHLYSKKKHNTKHFKTPDDWKHFYAHIKKAIDGFQFFNNDIRDEMLNKIGIFNQISINSLYYDFCKTFQTDNSDLWPVFGSGLSLYNIRNKLIHGIQSGDELFLIYANTHLKWIVERCLLAIIGWKNDNNVDPDILRKYNPYREWRQHHDKNEI